MASSARYHLVPEEGRPSIDSNPDASRRLIDAESNTSSVHDQPRINSKEFHITLLFRFITFAFFLASAIVLGLRQGYHGPYWNAPSEVSIPSIVFLSIALARNVYVVFSYFVSSAVKVSFSLRIRGRGETKPRLPGWLKGIIIGVLIDGTIILALLITLPIGLAQSAGWYTKLQDGFIAGLVGLPFYIFSMFDGGDPRSITLSLYLTRKWKKDSDEPTEPSQQYRDLEAQLPDVTRVEPGAEGQGEVARESIDV